MRRPLVVVEGIYDDETGNEFPRNGSEARKLNNAFDSLPSFVYLDGNRSQFENAPGEYHGGHLHHKTLLIDDERLLTGSYNWSLAARDTNLEILFDFRDPWVTGVFAEEFDRIVSKAVPAPRPLHSENPDSEFHLRIVPTPPAGICWQGA